MGKMVENYKSLKQTSLTSESLKKYRVIAILIPVVLGVNYILSLFPVYNFLFWIFDRYLFDIYFYISPTILEIKEDMYAHGDKELFERYFVFSVFNISVVFFTIISSFLFFSGERDRNKDFNLGLYFVFVLLFVLLCLAAATVFNEAGYHNSRFPINPQLGNGAFFFCRDTMFFFAAGGNVMELVIMIFMMTGKNIKDELNGQ